MNDDSSSRLAANVRRWIADAAPGSRLPSSRQLVAEHQVSPLTVQKALRTLEREGLVEARPGVGTFVRARRSHLVADYSWQTRALRDRSHPSSGLSSALRTIRGDVIALHAGYPDRDLLPERLVRSALTRAARSESALDRTPTAGLPDLQSWFAQELRAAAPAEVTPPTANDVIITPGTQSGLVSVFRSLAAPGEALLVEAPTYWGAILAGQRAGLRIVPVASGPDGPDPEDLDHAFAETGARVFYAQPNFANPTGVQWAIEAHARVMDVVRAHHAFLVEDDWAHDFGITSGSTPVVLGDSDGHVVYLRSLTKSVSPAVRVGAVVARGPARERILADRESESMYVSGLLQATALDVVTHRGWEAHLRRLRESLGQRRDLLLRSVAAHAPGAVLDHLPAGGLNLWWRLPDGTDVTRVASDCERRGLAIAPGAEWFPAEPTAPFVRLNFSGPDPGSFPEGARIFGDVLAEQA